MDRNQIYILQTMSYNKFRSIYDNEALLERLSRIRHVALDMDGTIYMGMTLFDYTRPFLARLREMGITYSFLTNNPSTSIADYLKKLAGMLIPKLVSASLLRRKTKTNTHDFDIMFPALQIVQS